MFGEVVKMRRYAYINDGVEEISLGVQLWNCKCFKRPTEELCEIIRSENHCCMGTNTKCELNSCPNNQK